MTTCDALEQWVGGEKGVRFNWNEGSAIDSRSNTGVAKKIVLMRSAYSDVGYVTVVPFMKEQLIRICHSWMSEGK